MTREASYTDSEGRQWAVTLPDHAPDADAPLGIPIGPPSLEALGLPIDVEVRIHNALFSRRLFTYRDVKGRRSRIMGALQAALKVDVVAIGHLYAPKPVAAPKPPKETKQDKAPKRGQQRRKRRK